MANHNSNSSKNQKPREQLNAYARYSSIAIQMLAIIGIGSFAGVKLDEYFSNTNNVLTIILSLSSVILAITYVIRQIISASKDKK